MSILLGLALASPTAWAQDIRALLQGFRHPPRESKPLVWWHWTNGNVTEQAITADLEAMQKVGVGGVQVFDVDVGNPQLVTPPVDYMSPRWLALTAFAARECKRLGLTMSVHNSAGWSESGGVWVTPKDGMRKLVWSEIQITGPTQFHGTLPSPPRVFGPYQGLAREKMGTPKERWPQSVPEDFEDARVIAFPTPAGRHFPGVAATLNSAAPDFDAATVTDGDFNTRVKLAFPSATTPVIVNLVFAEPFAAQAITLAEGWLPPSGELQSSGDGKTWTKVVDLPKPSVGSRPVPKTVAFATVTSKAFRLVFLPRTSKLSFELAEIALTEAPTVHRFEDKAGFSLLPDVDFLATTAAANTDGIDPTRVLDLTKLFKQGAGHWDVPAGRWTIMRLGHAATGMKNRPATAAGLGLESDKLNPAAVGRHINTLLSRLDKAGVLRAGSVNAVLMDSWEAEHQNWTPAFIDEFKRRRGYDPLPFLPAMSGLVVGDREQSDRFLWDVRRTIADALADNHYGVVAKALHARGLELQAEAVGQGMPMTADQLQTRGRADVPMGEFWVTPAGKPLVPKADCKEAASAAHVYGKRIVGAEAFSSGPDVPAWSQTPRNLKAVGDLHFATGINRLSLHQYTLQPDDTRKPGLTLKEYGSPFNRLNNWWEASASWFAYLARTQFILQQGWFVGDVLYLYAEGAPCSVPELNEIVPAIDEGRGYDFVNVEALSRHATVKQGELQFPNGKGYKLLVLPQGQRATPTLLANIERLVRAGAAVLGSMPTQSPSLTGGRHADDEVKALAHTLWGPCTSNQPCENKLGKGRVVGGYSAEAYLKAKAIAPDLQLAGTTIQGAVAHMHRQTASVDIYFLANITEQPQTLKATFRVAAGSAQLWFAETNETRQVPFTSIGNHTEVDLKLRALESVFVVLQKASTANTNMAQASIATAASLVQTLTGPWKVSFTSATKRTNPSERTMTTLSSLSESQDLNARHFAGVVTYESNFKYTHATPNKVALDLGVVRDIASVQINGLKVGTYWNLVDFDVTPFVKPGDNSLQITVFSSWPNRLIGDAALAPELRTTWTPFRPYTTKSPLQQSGLIGPVQLRN